LLLLLLVVLLQTQVLHPLAMQPAIRSQQMDVRVKNSYNRQASGTIISKTRDMNCSLVTSIVLKNTVTLVDIVSSRMLGQYGEWRQCGR
jgi:aspartate kinase